MQSSSSSNSNISPAFPNNSISDDNDCCGINDDKVPVINPKLLELERDLNALGENEAKDASEGPLESVQLSNSPSKQALLLEGTTNNIGQESQQCRASNQNNEDTICTDNNNNSKAVKELVLLPDSEEKESELVAVTKGGDLAIINMDESKDEDSHGNNGPEPVISIPPQIELFGVVSAIPIPITSLVPPNCNNGSSHIHSNSTCNNNIDIDIGIDSKAGLLTVGPNNRSNKAIIGYDNSNSNPSTTITTTDAVAMSVAVAVAVAVVGNSTELKETEEDHLSQAKMEICADSGDMVFRDLRMKCPFCDGCYRKTHDLYAHIRSHQNHTNCPHCNKVLTCMATFVYHVRTHTGEKPYYCPMHGCGFENAVKYNLKVHLASVRHGGKDNLAKYANILDLDVCDQSLRKRKDTSVHELGSRRMKKRRRISNQIKSERCSMMYSAADDHSSSSNYNSNANNNNNNNNNNTITLDDEYEQYAAQILFNLSSVSSIPPILSNILPSLTEEGDFKFGVGAVTGAGAGAHNWSNHCHSHSNYNPVKQEFGGNRNNNNTNTNNHNSHYLGYNSNTISNTNTNSNGNGCNNNNNNNTNSVVNNSNNFASSAVFGGSYEQDSMDATAANNKSTPNLSASSTVVSSPMAEFVSTGNDNNLNNNSRSQINEAALQVPSSSSLNGLNSMPLLPALLPIMGYPSTLASSSAVGDSSLPPSLVPQQQLGPSNSYYSQHYYMNCQPRTNDSSINAIGQNQSSNSNSKNDVIGCETGKENHSKTQSDESALEEKASTSLESPNIKPELE